MTELLQPGASYFLAGICGAGMSSLAMLLDSMGMQVRGSDTISTGPEAKLLRSQGIDVFSEADGAAVLQDNEVVVRSSAIHPDNPILLAAGRLGLCVVHRTDILAAVVSRYFLIAVAGTHGKTTTAGMIGFVLASMGFEPVIYVGGHIVGFNRYFPSGQTAPKKICGRPILVLETDESDGSFLKFHADVAVVTNIDSDHLGAYGGKFTNLVAAFEQFIAQCAEREGPVIGCGDDAEVSKLIRGMKQSVLYGELDSNQVKISYDAKTNSAAVARGDTAGLFHMVRGDEKSYQNAVAAALACEAAGVPFDEALHLLKVFPGMERRMQVLGEWRGVTVLTDHADHPTEIRATLQAVSVRYPGRRLVLVLQPHRYSRVSTCLERYGPALSGASRIILLDIYAASETTEQPDALNERLRASIETVVGGSLQKRMSAQQALEDLLASVVPGDVVLFMGPGDVNRLGLLFYSLLSGSNAVEYDPVAHPTVQGQQEND